MRRIRARAHLLKEQRESERQRFVQEMYDKQWRDACDDARTLDSNAVVKKLVRDRKAAVNYREGDGKAKAAELAAEQAALWKKQVRHEYPIPRSKRRGSRKGGEAAKR